MTFRVGQKVVCVKIGRGPSWAKSNGLRDAEIGAIYTIRQIYIGFDGEVAVRLHEISNPLHPITGREFGFYAYRFRSAIRRKTDITMFTEILRTTKAPVKAHAITSTERGI